MFRFEKVTPVGIAVFPLFFCAAMLAGSAAKPVEVSGPLSLKEEFLGEKSPDTAAEDKKLEDKVSPSGERVAWRDKHGGKWQIMLNGKPQGPEFDDVQGLVFSPDSQHFAYFGRHGKNWSEVLDGLQQKGQYSDIGDVIFSDGSEHRVYAGKVADRWVVVSDGLEGPKYEKVGRPRWSPKGGRLAYAAMRRGTWVVVDNGRESGRELQDGYSLVGFTPAQEKLISVGWENKGFRVVVGDNEGPLFDLVALPVRFGATDDDFAYAAARIKRYMLKEERAFGQVVVGNGEGREYEAEPVQSTGKMWLEGLGGRWKALTRGIRYQVTSTKHGVSAPAYSPDGKHLAYAARLGDKRVAVVVDGNEGPAFESIPCAPAFDPDGRLLYAGFQPGKLILIGDGTQLNEFRWASDDWKADDICAEIKFYEGGHFAYATARGVAVEVSEHVDKLKARMFIDGQPGTEYEAKFVTAARVQVLDGKFHSVYEVHREKQHDSRSFIVLDGQEGKPYDAILAGSAHFRGAGEVTFIARSGRKFFQVTQSR